MKRRDFIKIVAGWAAGAWPLAAVQAQQGAMPVIGFLNVQSASGRPRQLDAFRRGLAETGYTENKNVAIEYRWADNRYDRLPELAADLVRRNVTVIVATGGAQAALAAKAATSTIPIVFTAGSDPVRAGLVSSLNRPGGNVTGFSFLTDALAAKRLGLLREIVRTPTTVAVLINPEGPDAQGQLKDVRAAANAIGQSIDILMASTQGEIDSAFAKISKNHAGALIVGADPFFNDRRQQIVALAARASLPAVYESREFVLVGGLMSYGASITDAYRQAGVYTARILNGEKPSELPVTQATKFDFVFNSKTAKALGVQLNPQLLATTDEVIE
jgi:putative tryptophan/tyrosine transport system substrate-binding protein